MSRRGPVAALLVVALVALGSCTSKTKPPPNPTPVAGGTLRVAVRDLATLDPARATGRGSQLVLAQVFDSLTAIDQEGNPIPGAASSWDVSADGKTWTFKLAAASFHNGARVTAYDFKFAFDRLTSKALASDAAFQLEPVSGFKAARIDGTAKGLSGVQVVNNDTLRIVLDRSFYELPEYLAHPALGPVSQKVFNHDPAGFGNQPVGNGPFKVSSPKNAQGVELARFDQHGGATAYLDGISIKLASDEKDGWSRYRSGSVDIAEVPASSIEAERGNYGPQGFTPFWAAVYYGPNLRLDKYKKPEVRRAISLAIDRAAIARAVYGGTKSPAVGLIPRGIAGFTASRCDACAYDSNQARTLLQQAFNGSPPAMIIDHLDASPSREVAGAIATNLKAAGLSVTLRPHSSAEYLQLLQSGKQEIAELGWLAEVPSPDGFLEQQLHSGSPNNQVAFSDPQFDSLADQARGTPDPLRRRDLYRQAEMRALDLMPLIPIVFFRNHIAVASRVRAVQIDGAGIFDAAAVWLAH